MVFDKVVGRLVFVIIYIRCNGSIVPSIKWTFELVFDSILVIFVIVVGGLSGPIKQKLGYFAPEFFCLNDIPGTRELLGLKILGT
jgi:hypothetical protein